MGKTVNIKRNNNIFTISFLNKCVYCGEEKDVTILLKLREHKYVGKKEEYSLEIDNKGEKLTNVIHIPFCKTHELQNNLYDNI